MVIAKRHNLTIQVDFTMLNSEEIINELKLFMKTFMKIKTSEMRIINTNNQLSYEIFTLCK